MSTLLTDRNHQNKEECDKNGQSLYYGDWVYCGFKVHSFYCCFYEDVALIN